MTLKELLLRAKLSFAFGHYYYGVAAGKEILQAYPGHLAARQLLGQASFEEGRFAEAASHFQALLELDPENALARSGLALILERQGQLKRAIAELERAFDANPGNPQLRDSLLSLRTHLERQPKGLELSPTARGRVLAKQGEHQTALACFSQALQFHPQRPELRLAQVESLLALGRLDEAEAGCRHLLAEHSTVLKAKVLLALVLLKKGQAAPASALIHAVTATDPSLMLARRPFKEAGFQLPDPAAHLEVAEPRTPLPPQVAQALRPGMDLEDDEEPPEELPLLETPSPGSKAPLPGGNGTAVSEMAQLLEELSQRLAPQARHRPSKTIPEGRTYLLVTHAGALRQKYGEAGFALIRRKLEGLAQALREKGVRPGVVYLDEEAGSVAALSAVTVKAHLDHVTSQLLRRGEPVEHVLLVGGPDIVPFYRLPNPTDDDDEVVLADVPYTSAEVNFYAPARSLGRLPDGTGGSPALLLGLMYQMMARLEESAAPDSSRARLFSWLPFLRQGQSNGRGKGFGLAALVWKGAATAVYAEIADPKTLHICPPVTTRSLEPEWLEGSRFLLFNLHGTEGSPHWYGQKDSTYPADYPLFPIALSPELIEGIDLTGAIVFTEACYGANLVDKRPGDSLALALLAAGAACVVGSTKIAYGSSAPPLGEADLLARLFFEELRRGTTAGQALARAKVAFARETHSRQGYLDGDDQKTIQSFILLGDPSARLAIPTPELAETAAKTAAHVPADYCPPLFCKHRALAHPRLDMSGELLAGIRRCLHQVAPETATGDLRVLPKQVCDHPPLAGHSCSGDCTREDKEPSRPTTFLITSRKAVPGQDGTLISRIAHLTMDQRGAILKVTLSK